MRYSNCLVCCFSFNVCCAFLLVGMVEKRNHVDFSLVCSMKCAHSDPKRTKNKTTTEKTVEKETTRRMTGQREINVIEQFGKETEMN